ncbi:hypothetical protein [Paenibacillus alvei]|uniref:hypothetical protein n=1 Tax=Paenibacillus alvei TaxID=44250 RepID=UPI0012698392|nr:hypothetical protein [Paenibacillus alvei]
MITTNFYKKKLGHAHHCASGSSSLENVPLASLVQLRIFGGDHQATRLRCRLPSRNIKKPSEAQSSLDL